MSAITESVSWTNDIYRIEENDPVEGGESGVDNRPHKDLANRTQWLKQQVEGEAITRAGVDAALAGQISQETLDRKNADNAKANLGGSNSQRFKVADAIDSDEAVSKSQLNTAIAGVLVFNTIYPIGIIVEFSYDANPNHLWPSTTWVRFSEGQVTVGYKGSDIDFGTVGQTGGKKGHKMTINNLIEHDHSISFEIYNEYGAEDNRVANANNNPENTFANFTTSKTGQADPDEIPTLMPYIVAAKWHRTA